MDTTLDFLPPDKLPECWHDETRMNVLFAPFRSRSANAHDWDSKLTFWKNLIYAYCMHHQVCTFKLDDMRKIFTRNGRSPSGLKVVVEEMLKAGEVHPLAQFLQNAPTNSWSKWIFQICIQNPLGWSYNKVKKSLIAEDVEHQRFIHPNALKNQAEALIAAVPANFKNKLINMEQLLEMNKSDINKLDHHKLLIQYLHGQGRASVREIDIGVKKEKLLHGFLIKINDCEKATAISDFDLNVYLLERNEKLLLDQVESLEKEINERIAQTKAYLIKGHKQMAKGCLRKKHELERRIAKRADALHNVQLLLSRMSDSDADSQILNAYKTALASMQKTFKEAGLTDDNVTDTMLELGEMLDIHQDMQAQLAQPLSDSEADLEEELAQLLAEDHDQPPATPPEPPPTKKPEPEEDDLEERLRRLRMNLPSVPLTPPGEKLLQI